MALILDSRRNENRFVAMLKFWMESRDHHLICVGVCVSGKEDKKDRMKWAKTLQRTIKHAGAVRE